MADLKGAVGGVLAAKRLPVLLCAVAGVLVLVLGGLVFVQAADRAGADAAAAAALADGPATVSGTLTTIYAEPEHARTVLALRGAEGLAFSAAGSLVDRYAVGEYVTVTGTKSGTAFSVGGIVRGVHPGAAAAPYFVAGGAMLAMMALFFLVPLMIGRGGGGGGRRGALLAPLKRLVRRNRAADPDSAPPQETGDNRSGAPAPKG